MEFNSVYSFQNQINEKEEIFVKDLTFVIKLAKASDFSFG